ncbi:MAG TPA: DUF362 domain-containing protein, partial [Gemmataceae bacterium]|nr:DUF362 domain-containing protein [Gemmataceae bacterium]
MQEILPVLEELKSLCLPDGAWGYAPGQKAHLEPTSLAILAYSLEAERFASWRDKAVQILLQACQADGGFRLEGDRDEATWPTALALFVMAALELKSPQRDKAIGRLLSVYVKQPDSAQAKEVHDIDMNLLGWPWAEGNFSWVEPTAWACLGLRKAGRGDELRVQQGLRLLLDRAFDDGGINYGNRTVLGKRTDPIPGPTALMLLALQGLPDHPRITAAVRYLLAHAEESQDVEHLCWASIALARYLDRGVTSQDLVKLESRIVDARAGRNATHYVREAPARVALAALALAGERNNFFAVPALSNPERIVDGRSIQSMTVAMPKQQKSFGERLGAKFRGMAIEAAGRLRPVQSPATVHVAPVVDYNADLADVLRRQYDSFRAKVPLAGKRVILKPNLVEYHRDKVINTHPNVIAAAIELCQHEGANEIVIAEGPGHWRNVEYLVQASGLGDVLRHYKVSFVDLNHDEFVKTPNMGRLTKLDHLYLTRTIVSADVVISMPKLKTHHWAGATLSLKNLFGTLPGVCYGWPKNELHWRGIDNSIVDIALTRTPELAIVDGIIGMEGDGPLNGNAKPFGALIMGNDLLAVDATCCRLMELNPERIAYLFMGYQKKLGLLREAEIQQLGESIAQMSKPFDT